MEGLLSVRNRMPRKAHTVLLGCKHRVGLSGRPEEVKLLEVLLVNRPILIAALTLVALLSPAKAGAARLVMEPQSMPRPDIIVVDTTCGPGWHRTTRGTCRRTLQPAAPVPRWAPLTEQDGTLRQRVQPRLYHQPQAPSEMRGPPPPHLRWPQPPPPPRWQEMRPTTPRLLQN